MILTRSPLNPPPKRSGPVRLACVKHAASVRPEPGSNSPNKTRTTHNQHQPPQPSKNRHRPGPNNRSRRKNPNPTRHPPNPQPRQDHEDQHRNRRNRERRAEKNTPNPPPPNKAKKNRAQPDPRETLTTTGPSTPNPHQHSIIDGDRAHHIDPRTRNHPQPAPRTPAQPRRRTTRNKTNRQPRTREPKNQADNQNNPQNRRNPSHPPKPRTQNMTHYRDLKQHTHRDSTARVCGPPPPGSARGASVSRMSEAISGPEPAVTGLLRLSSPRPPSGHWISPSPLGPERTLRTGGEAVKPRDGEPAHNAGPPPYPPFPGRFPDPAPRQGRRATARVRRPLRTSTTPPASSCSWAIGASSSSTLTLLR